jgi:hypothetical protein
MQTTYLRDFDNSPMWDTVRGKGHCLSSEFSADLRDGR